MRLLAPALMMAVIAGSAQAACEVESSVYREQKTLGAADAYIACFERTGALVLPTSQRVTFGEIASGTPTFGPVAPGNPNGMPVTEYLRQLKELGGYSDFDWTQIMAETMTVDESFAVVYDKNRVAPQYADDQPFLIKATPQFKVDQFFADPAKFKGLSQLMLEAGE